MHESVEKHLSIITLMKVDPEDGRLFVAGYSRVNNGYPSGAIYPYSMDGGPVAEADVIGSPKTGIPSGLALDMITRQVYWSDITSKDISMCDYEGRNCQVVTSSLQGHPNFLAFYERKLYWLIGEQGSIYTHDILSQETSYRYSFKILIPFYFIFI